MCGIVGITSNKEVTTRIVNSLKKLEYRGYDSAGIATIINGIINITYFGDIKDALKIVYKSVRK